MAGEAASGERTNIRRLRGGALELATRQPHAARPDARRTAIVKGGDVLSSTAAWSASAVQRARAFRQAHSRLSRSVSLKNTGTCGV